jgi:hypothetical protein
MIKAKEGRKIMVLLIGFMVILFCFVIGVGIINLGRYLSVKAEKAGWKPPIIIFLRWLFRIIPYGVIIFGIYVMWNIIEFVRDFP